MIASTEISFEVYYSKEVTPLGNTRLVINSEKNSDSFVAKIIALPRDFINFSMAIEDATYINHITGEPFLRTSLLYRKVLERFIQAIILEDEMPPLVIKPLENLNFDYVLLKEIARNWLKYT